MSVIALQIFASPDFKFFVTNCIWAHKSPGKDSIRSQLRSRGIPDSDNRSSSSLGIRSHRPVTDVILCCCFFIIAATLQTVSTPWIAVWAPRDTEIISCNDKKLFDRRAQNQQGHGMYATNWYGDHYFLIIIWLPQKNGLRKQLCPFNNCQKLCYLCPSVLSISFRAMTTRITMGLPLPSL